MSLRFLRGCNHFLSEKVHSIGWAAGRQGFKFSRRRIKNYENPRARRDVYTCRPGSQEFSATWVGGASGDGGGGGQIKLRREIYGRTCNEQLFHGMRTPGLASGGGISIRSSSCRPRARGPRPLLRVALPREFYSAKKERLIAHTSTTVAVASDSERTRNSRWDDILFVTSEMYRNHFIESGAHNFVLRYSALNPLLSYSERAGEIMCQVNTDLIYTKMPQITIIFLFLSLIRSYQFCCDLCNMNDDR